MEVFGEPNFFEKCCNNKPTVIYGRSAMAQDYAKSGFFCGFFFLPHCMACGIFVP